MVSGMMTDEQLEEIFKTVGNEYKFKEVHARFEPFKEMKVRWQRTYYWVSFQISDYLQNAPANVIESLAHYLFNGFGGERGDDAVLKEWTSGELFRVHNIDAYLKRHNAIGMVGEYGEYSAYWTADSNAYASKGFKVVLVPESYKGDAESTMSIIKEKIEAVEEME